MSTTQSVRIPFDMSSSDHIDTLQAKVKSATADVRKLERALMDAKKLGLPASATTGQALKMARDRLDTLKQEVAQEKEKGKWSAETSRQLRGVERLATRIRGVFGNTIFQKMSLGQPVDAKDVFRLAVSSERAIVSTGRLLKIKPETMQKMHPYLQAAVEAAYLESGYWKQGRQMWADAELLKLKLDRGLIGPKQIGLYKEALGIKDGKPTAQFAVAFIKTALGIDPGMEQFQRNEQKASLLGEMNAQQIDLATNKFKQEYSDQNKWSPISTMIAEKVYGKTFMQNITDRQTGKALRGEDVRQTIQNAIEHEKNRLHVAVLPKEFEENAIREAAAGIGITDAMMESVQKDSAARSLKERLDQTPDFQFNLARRQKMYHAQIETYAKRVPNCSTD